MRRQALLTAALGCAGTAALAGCGSGGGTHDVVVGAAAARTVTVQPGGSGSVAAAVDIPVSLGYLGRVSAVDVSVGQSVTAGQRLLSVTSGQLDLDIRRLTVGLRLDQDNLAALQAQLGAPSKQPAPGVVAALRSKAATLQSRVHLDAQQLAAARAKTGTLTAPVAGVVAAVRAAPGQSVRATSALLEILDYSKVTVRAYVPAADLGLVRLGSPAVVDATTASGVQLAGKVTGVAPGLAPGGQQFQVTVTADNPHGTVRPGMAAYVRVEVSMRVPVAVDTLAVLNADTVPSVFVVSGTGVSQRRVVLGVSDDRVTQVVRGLAPGDRVVVAGVQTLADGTRVHVTGSAAP